MFLAEDCSLDLQKRIASDRIDMPIIFITGHCDIPLSVQAMKTGAIEFLTKPFGKECAQSRDHTRRTIAISNRLTSY